MTPLKAAVQRRLDDLTTRIPALHECAERVAAMFEALRASFAAGHRLLLCGNGGSAADCEHIAGELLKGFGQMRPLAPNTLPGLEPEIAGRLQGALPAIPLTGFIGAVSAFNNDVSAELSFAQLTQALGRPGDNLLGISTSGNARNVIAAFKVARAKGMTTLLLSGRSGGNLRPLADIAVCVPAEETRLVQELHLPVYHALCLMLEDEFFTP